jgi:hypothetical protein
MVLAASSTGGFRSGIRCALLALCLAAPVLQAQAAPRPRVVVWFDEASEPPLVERIRGQCSDLDLEIILYRSPRVSGDVGAVTEIAEQRRAAVVVWSSREDPHADRLTVHVADPAHHRLLSREVGSGGVAEDPSSATLEAAALVIREALRAIAAGEPIGEEAPPAPPPPPAATQTASPPAPVPSSRSRPMAPAPPVPETAVPMRWQVGMAWESAWDGATPYGQPGPGLSVFLQRGSLDVGLFATAGIPSRIENDHGAVRLSRHAAGAWLGLVGAPGARASVAVGLRLGLLGYYRSTEETAGVAAAAPSLKVYALLGPELRLGYRPTPADVRLVLSGGLDLAPRAPEIGYEVGGQVEPVLSPWHLQPRLGLGAEFGVFP